MNHRLLNLLAVSASLFFIACDETAEINVSRDLGYNFEIIASEITDDRFFVSQSIDIGGDEFEDFEILDATINSLSYSISGIDSEGAFSTWFLVGGANSLSSSFQTTPTPIENVTEQTPFWTAEDGFLENDFFEDNPDINAFISGWESAIQSKTPYDVTVLGEAMVGDDFVVTLHVDVTCAAEE